MSFSDSDFGATRLWVCFHCKGDNKKDIYWKDEKKKEIGSFEEFCPVCRANSPSPILREGQVEISHDEYEGLRGYGWIVRKLS